MRCYQHPDIDAVAICKRCGKASCKDCSHDSSQGIACSEPCAQRLLEDEQLDASLKRSLGVGQNAPMPASVSAYFFFGLILLLTGVYLSVSRPGIDFLTLAISAVFFVMCGVSYKRYRDACLTC